MFIVVQTGEAEEAQQSADLFQNTIIFSLKATVLTNDWSFSYSIKTQRRALI